jgi:hypothetical protein
LNIIDDHSRLCVASTVSPAPARRVFTAGDVNAAFEFAAERHGEQPRPGALGVVVVAAAQQPADAVERVARAAAVPGLFALDAAPDVVDRSEPEPHHMERIQHPRGVGQAVRSALA